MATLNVMYRMASTGEEAFLSVSDVCARWNIDRRTLEKLMTDGGLPYIEYPPPVRVRRFPLSVVVAFERQHFRGTTAGDS